MPLSLTTVVWITNNLVTKLLQRPRVFSLSSMDTSLMLYRSLNLKECYKKEGKGELLSPCREEFSVAWLHLKEAQKDHEQNHSRGKERKYPTHRAPLRQLSEVTRSFSLDYIPTSKQVFLYQILEGRQSFQNQTCLLPLFLPCRLGLECIT